QNVLGNEWTPLRKPGRILLDGRIDAICRFDFRPYHCDPFRVEARAEIDNDEAGDPVCALRRNVNGDLAAHRVTEQNQSMQVEHTNDMKDVLDMHPYSVTGLCIPFGVTMTAQIERDSVVMRRYRG